MRRNVLAPRLFLGRYERIIHTRLIAPGEGAAGYRVAAMRAHRQTLCGGFLGTPFFTMMTDDAGTDRANDHVMTRVVAGDASHHCGLQAAGGIWSSGTRQSWRCSCRELIGLVAQTATARLCASMNHASHRRDGAITREINPPCASQAVHGLW